MKKNLGLGALIALVLSSMVGAGIFSLPQNITANAQVGAIAIGWLITGVGMIALALVYQFLSLRRPDLDGGIFTYAKAGFGSLIGFNAAWGYWICQLLANVSYVVVLCCALSYFVDTPEQVILGGHDATRSRRAEKPLHRRHSRGYRRPLGRLAHQRRHDDLGLWRLPKLDPAGL